MADQAVADPWADVLPKPAPVVAPQPAADPWADVLPSAGVDVDPYGAVVQPAPQTFHQDRLAQLGPGASPGFYDSLAQNAQAEQAGNQARQFGALQQALTRRQPTIPSLGRGSVPPVPLTDQGFWTGLGQGVLNAGGSLARGAASTVAALSDDPENLRTDAMGQPIQRVQGGQQFANDLSDFVDAQRQERLNANQAHAGAQTAAENVAGLLPFALGAPGVALVAGTAGGNRRQDVLEGGGSETKANLAGLGEGALMSAIPAAGSAVRGALSPLAKWFTGKAATAVGDQAAGRIANAGVGALEGEAVMKAQGLGDAGISAATGDMDRAKAELAGDPNSELGFSALSALLGGAAHPSVHGRPVEAPARPAGPDPWADARPQYPAGEAARLDDVWAPYAKAPADQAIQAPASGPLSGADVAELRKPAPEFQRPTPEEVAHDSTPEAERRAFEKAKTDPFDDFDPEQIGQLGRASGGAQTELDLEGKARLAAAQHPTEDLPAPGSEQASPRDTAATVPREPETSKPSTDHLTPEAQAALAAMPEEIRNHPLVQETVADRKSANDKAGDLGNVAQAALFAQRSLDRAKAKANAEPTPAPVRAEDRAAPEALSPEAKAAADRAGVTVDRTHDVPLGGGVSEDGKTVYIDRGMPRSVTLPDGRPVDAHASIIAHETAEHGAMRLGEDYETAHNGTANPAENARLEAQGIKPAEFNAALRPHLDAAAERGRAAVQSGTAQNLPPDLHPLHVEAGAKAGVNPPKVTKAGAAALEHVGDVLDDIREAGGIAPRPKGHTGGEYDRPHMPLAHAKAISGTVAPDVMAKTLADKGIGDGTTNGMWKAVEKASDARLKPPSDANEEPGPVLDKRPDLANPLESDRARDGYVEHRNQQPTPETRKQADVRTAAKAAIAHDFEGEYNRLRALGESHALMDDHDTASAQEMLQQLWDKGRVEDFERLARVYQVSGTEQGRGLAMRADRIQTPQGRLGEARSQAVLNKAEARIQDRLEKAMAPLREHIADLTKQAEDHKQALAAAKRSAAGDKARPTAGRVARQQFKATLAKWGKRMLHGGGGSHANAFAEGAYEIVRDGVKAGILSFPDLVRAAAQGIRAIRHEPEAHKALESAWDEAQGKDATMEARAHGAAEAIASDPAMSLEKRIADAQKRYDGLAEYKRKLAADLAAMTPEQRVTFMEGEAAAKKLPPEVQAIHDAGNKQLREIEAEIAKLTKTEKEAPAEKQPKPERVAAAARIKTLQEQRDAVRRRLGESRFRINAQRDRLAAMSHEDRLAEARNRKPPLEVSLDEADARKELASLRRELDTLRNPREEMGPVISRQIKAAQDRYARMQKEYNDSQTRSAKRNAADMERLKKLGFDLKDNDPAWVHSPGGFENFQAALRATKGGWGAVAQEALVGMLHFSSGVWAKKIASDVGIAGPTYLAQRLGEAIANKVPGNTKPGAGFRELGHILGASLPAAGRGIVEGMKTLISEKTPEFLKSEKSPEHYPVMRGIGGAAFRHLTLLTSVRAIDVASRTFIARMEVAAQAHRSAIDAQGKRLVGKEYDRHIADEVGNVLSDSWAKARQEAMERTYTNKNDRLTSFIEKLKHQDTTGSVGKKVLKVAASLKFPILGIPAKIFIAGAQHWTPILSDAIAMRNALRYDKETGDWTYDRNKFNSDVARAAMRWGMTAAAVSLYNNGTITGHDDANHPDSVKLWGKWVSYKEIPGLSFALPAVADWLHGGAEGLASGALHKVADSPWARPLQDVYYAIGAKDGWTKYAASSVPVPSIYRQYNASQQENAMKRSGVADGDAWERFKTYVADNAKAQYPAKTAEGIPIQRDEIEGHPTLTKIFRMMSPMQMGTKESTEGDFAAVYKGSQAPLEQLAKLKRAAKVGGRQEDQRAADRYEDDHQDELDHARDLRDVQKAIKALQDEMQKPGADVKAITNEIRTEALRGLKLVQRRQDRVALNK